MKQQTLAAQSGFERYGKKTRREQFLEEMDQVVPWAEQDAPMRLHYPKVENGRPPMGLGMMLRAHFLHQWFNLSDPAAEKGRYDSPVLRRFCGSRSGACTGAGRDDDLQVLSSAGGARSGRRHAGCGEPASGERRHPHRDRSHCGRDDHPCAVVDEEHERRP